MATLLSYCNACWAVTLVLKFPPCNVETGLCSPLSNVLSETQKSMFSNPKVLIFNTQKNWEARITPGTTFYQSALGGGKKKKKLSRLFIHRLTQFPLLQKSRT